MQIVVSCDVRQPQLTSCILNHRAHTDPNSAPTSSQHSTITRSILVTNSPPDLGHGHGDNRTVPHGEIATATDADGSADSGRFDNITEGQRLSRKASNKKGVSSSSSSSSSMSNWDMDYGRASPPSCGTPDITGAQGTRKSDSTGTTGGLLLSHANSSASSLQSEMTDGNNGSPPDVSLSSALTGPTIPSSDRDGGKVGRSSRQSRISTGTTRAERADAVHKSMVHEHEQLLANFIPDASSSGYGDNDSLEMFFGDSGGADITSDRMYTATGSGRTTDVAGSMRNDDLSDERIPEEGFSRVKLVTKKKKKRQL